MPQYSDQLVLGLGEVGSILHRMLRCEGYDPKYTVPIEGRFDVLHVIFPYGPLFIQQVREAVNRYGSRLIIIHSTVPIGTTRQIPHAVHSPVNGRRDSMEADLRAYTKWVGGSAEDAALAAATLRERGGFTTHIVASSDISEALKLLCLSRYGVDIAFSYYASGILGKVGGSVDDLLDWTANYNRHVSRDRVRPTIYPHGTTIGGHCVCPVTRMLYEDFPNPMLEEVLKHASKEEQ